MIGSQPEPAVAVVVTPQHGFPTRPLSIRELRDVCQREKWQHSRGLTRANRYLSIYITAIALRWRVRANTITLLSMGLGFGAAALLMSSGGSAQLVAVVLLYLSFLLDQVDGEVARFHRAATLTGTYLDELRHILIYAVPLFGLGAGLTIQTQSQMPVLAGFLGAMSLIVLRVNAGIKYTLFTKKLLCRVNGPVIAPRSDSFLQDPQTLAEPLTPGLKRILRRVMETGSYVLTNQVSILILLLVFVASSPLLSAEHRGVLFAGYAGLLTILTAWDVFAMAWFSKIERACTRIASELEIHIDRSS